MMNRMVLVALVAGSICVGGVAQAAGDAAAGKAKAAPCLMCHGPAGQGTQVGPKIAGLDQAVFVQALKDYASGKKVNALMKAQTGGLSDADEANLAAFFATLK